MSSTEFLDLPAARHAAGTVILPGSKSISNRVLLLSALAAGVTRIEGVLQSDDTRVMLAALTQLGVGIETHGPDSVSVRGAEQFPIREADLFLGNAGTAIRPLTAALALMDGHYRLSGVPRMHERPIGDLVDGLREMGARIAYVGREGYPPLEVSPCGSLADRVRVQGSVSSQFLTAVLMAAPLAVARTGRALAIEVIGELISRPYIEITLNLMSRFGVTVTRSGWQQFVVQADSRYRSPGRIFVEGDASSASYFLAMGAIGGGPVRVVGVGADSIQGDIAFADTVAAMGATVRRDASSIEVTGVRVAEGGRLRAFDADFNLIPDAAMTAAALALFADGLRVTPVAPGLWRDACIDTYDDHRMAMCLSLAAFGEATVRIMDPGCVSKTFPTYFDVYAGLLK